MREVQTKGNIQGTKHTRNKNLKREIEANYKPELEQ